MSARKLFTNKCKTDLHVTLHVRSSENPNTTASTEAFYLRPGESQWREYGNRNDIYLNGIEIIAQSGDYSTAEKMTVIVRGSPLDNALNMMNAVDIEWAGNAFSIRTHQAGR